jgi:hypothetical protein
MGEEIERDRKDGEVKGKMEGRGRKTEQECKASQDKAREMEFRCRVRAHSKFKIPAPLLVIPPDPRFGSSFFPLV